MYLSLIHKIKLTLVWVCTSRRLYLFEHIANLASEHKPKINNEVCTRQRW